MLPDTDAPSTASPTVLLLVDGDPNVDIKATRDIVAVWKLGVQDAHHSSRR